MFIKANDLNQELQKIHLHEGILQEYLSHSFIDCWIGGFIHLDEFNALQNIFQIFVNHCCLLCILNYFLVRKETLNCQLIIMNFPSNNS